MYIFLNGIHKQITDHNDGRASEFGQMLLVVRLASGQMAQHVASMEIVLVNFIAVPSPAAASVPRMSFDSTPSPIAYRMN